MWQNADGTWTVVRKLTYTSKDPDTLLSQLRASRPLGRMLVGQVALVIEDITDSEPDKSRMPEPMPGMIVQSGPRRVAVREVVCDDNGTSWSVKYDGYVGWETWDVPHNTRVWSPTHVLLWERPTP